MTPYIRTPEHRALRAKLIRLHKPWTRSTGPRTPEGIERIRQRQCRGYKQKKAKALARALRELSRRLDDMQR